MRPDFDLPYSDPRCVSPPAASTRQDLERLRGIWADCQATRDRNAIYGYLGAVYGLVAWWTAEGREARWALRWQRLQVSDREDPLAAIIRCTADPAKADKRTRSKWSRVLRLRCGVQVGFGAPGPIHPQEGRHQRLRHPVVPAAWAK
jgi:hypothetical protein